MNHPPPRIQYRRTAMSDIEQAVRVAYLGPEGTYSHNALLKYFGPHQKGISCDKIEQVFTAVENGDCEYGLVPVENSSEGSVSETLDCLSQSSLKICGEVLLRIQHVLMAKDRLAADKVQKIISHQQSLGQCRNWLDKHYPGVERVAASSNGEAARIAATEKGVAAIASKNAALLNQLQILSENIQDSKDNTTRFLVLSKRLQPAPTGNDRTSLLVITRNEPGALFNVLEPLKSNGVNLNKLESRPTRKEVWSYAFYIDIDGHQDDANISKALRELRDKDIDVEVLGSYPVLGIVHEDLQLKQTLPAELLDKKIVIIGLGLIGGSIAKGLHGHDNIWAVGKNEISLHAAQTGGVIRGFSTRLEELCADADLIVIAVPGLSIESVFSALKNVIKADCILTDVASVKQPTLDAARSVFGEIPPNLVPGHPIAGSEKSGYSAATAGLFAAHRVILTPLPVTDPSALVLIETLWQSLGAEVLRMAVDEHDKILAATSHLPHLLAYALVDTLSQQGTREEIFRYAAGGFRDFTRIASSDPQMWHDIFISNHDALSAILQEFEDDLARIKHALAEKDSASIMQTLQRAKLSRDRFLNKK
jgi:chorismate mutase/prephenate dehydratase